MTLANRYRHLLLDGLDRLAALPARFGAAGGLRHGHVSHTAAASPFRCRNCGSKLDFTDISCSACGRKITRFSLRP